MIFIEKTELRIRFFRFQKLYFASVKRLPKVCILGIGNVIRSDDGLGPYICSALEGMCLPGVMIMTMQQLDTGLLEDLQTFDHILLVDAAMTEDDVLFYPLQDHNAIISSHHLNGAVLKSLSQILFDQPLSIWICGIRGASFDIGDQLTETAKANAAKAVQVINDWVQSLY